MQTQKGKGMNKFLKVGLFSATFLFISATHAAPLEDAMKSLAKNSKAFEKAQTVELAQTALDEMVKQPHESPSIGIILCKEKNNKIVEFAFRDTSKPMGVVTYKTYNDLPEAYKNILPDTETLKALL